MSLKPIVALFAASLAATPLAAQTQGEAPQQPATTLKATHGAWEVRCDTQKDNLCGIAQVGKREDGQPVLRVTLQKTPGAKGPKNEPIAALLQIDAPLGVLLPPGVEVKIDGKAVGRAGFQVCDRRACIASAPVPEQFISQMKAGSNAVMSIVAVNGTKADVPISLNGFTKAYNAL